jgi:phosphoribosylformimino-5-aminoimidazole carboxamide ribotide isomerase
MTTIIPAIDIIDGKCVRLSQGEYEKKTIYNENPLEVAKQFEQAGIKRLHMVDLDGAKVGKIVNWNVLEKVATNTRLVIDFGGGIKSDESITAVFNSGAALATVGSVAVKSPELFFSWIEKFGAEKILLGADVKNEKIAISGWLENTNVSVLDFISDNLKKGVKNIFCTDVSKDGMLQGPSLDLYKKILAENQSFNFIASGGVSSIKNVETLQEIGCQGVIIGKAIYEGLITLNELKKYVS